MEIVLFFCALAAFSLFPAISPLVLRCGLSACLRFSPLAAAALASLSSLCSSLFAWLFRRGYRAASPDMLLPIVLSSIAGGTLGRALLLMFTARHSGSLSLLRLQSVPLLLLSLTPVVSAYFQPFSLPRSPMLLALFSFLCAAMEGFFGAGGVLLFSLVFQGGVCRKKDLPSSSSLLLGFAAQSSAILFTFLCSASQVFPFRMLASLASGAVAGIWIFEKRKKHSALHSGMRAALIVYGILCALAGTEQAFR